CVPLCVWRLGKMAVVSTESMMNLSSNVVCNFSGSSRRPLAAASHSPRRRKLSYYSQRVRAISSSFLASLRLCSTVARLSALQNKQQRMKFSAFAIAAGIIRSHPFSHFLYMLFCSCWQICVYLFGQLSRFLGVEVNL
ncbi:Unknown protein, partial [Striga hermonthica]